MANIGAQFVQAVQPVPVGSLQAFAGADAPTGWLLCNGSSYSTSAYPELFSVLGYTYGGSGANFNVPDLRGRVPMGAGTGAQNGGAGTGAISGGTSLTARTRGAFGGDERLQQHNHTASDSGHTHQVGSNSGPDNLSGPHTGNYDPNTFGIAFYYTTTTGYANISVANTGSGSGQNMPPFVVTNYIIKALTDIPRSGVALGSTPPIVTALPTNPQFGEVVTYVADATNGVYWDLQYDASGTYPWKFIGGSPLTAQIDTDETIVAGTTTYTALATAGPSITLARAGDYVISQGCRGYPFANNQSLHMSYDIGATPASDSDSVLLDCASGFGENGSRTKLKTGISANSAIVSKYKHTSSGAAANFSYRWMTVTPVRVSA
jgi:microcystin-dependent protein